ncbi:hypothetical protein QBC32DRAFT_219205 [Pseudoneurospora amorphoporcata]|uniref:DUF167 domain-containing protein n=1 Tax=Pseudoneurospora amorphoporcata TaxID=241081 RepID=A0AAN6SDK4_9PEZI|nr:hypothetical protein QBC32DRAFT_219205 [Pseudoneurospora amorphoporcata]
MSTQRALWFVASKATKKSSPQGSQAGTIYIHCRVKPGASKQREGVTSLTDEAVDICVAAQAKEGEANKAVVRVLSEALNLPKSNLEITQGLKSRAKTVAVAAPGSWVGGNGGEAECLERVKAYLNEATEA